MSTQWQPTASIEHIKARTNLYNNIRNFFQNRNIIEVQTPILSQHTVTDVFIESFKTTYIAGNKSQEYFLQTSPEYHMKRLLAAGSGSIFQITPAFRNHGEFGAEHNPEFNLLEWYHVGFNHHDLMQEVSDLLQNILNCKPADKISYQQLFEKYFNINPHTCSVDSLIKIAQTQNLNIETSDINKDDWLNLLLTHVIEPELGREAPVFIYDYPKSQAALAKIRNDDIPVAERFEIYINGQELGNGFHELTDAKQQESRFHNDQQTRLINQQDVPSVDKQFIESLNHGLPDCAGIAIGLDRLLMLQLKQANIRDILAFSWDIA